jgi:acetoin utilization protein AcuC
VRAIFLYNPAVVEFDYGRSHPFRLERIWLAEYLSRSLKLFDLPEVQKRSFEPALPDELRVIHDSSYLDVLQAGSAGVHLPGLGRHGLASGDNPVFPGLWEYSLYTAGGTLTGARLLAGGESRRVFHPGGGLHHALRERASGFCYVNDVALAIQLLRDQGKRVFYLDLDAHHGDGVEAAFYGTRDVLTFSIHQDGRTLFPGSGFPHETGGPEATGFAVNVPLLPGMSDPEYERVWLELVVPLLGAFAPDVVVTELGADALLGDPLTNLELSLRGWWTMLRALAALDLPWLAVGGGGYDLGNAMRAWTLAWAAMVGVEPAEDLPPRPGDLPGVAAGMRWPRDLWSAPAAPSHDRPGSEAIAGIVEEVRGHVFPSHGL